MTGAELIDKTSRQLLEFYPPATVWCRPTTWISPRASALAPYRSNSSDGIIRPFRRRSLLVLSHFSVSFLPDLKLASRFAAVSPVRGLRPCRSFLSFTKKLPHPRMSTGSFDRSVSAIYGGSTLTVGSHPERPAQDDIALPGEFGYGGPAETGFHGLPRLRRDLGPQGGFRQQCAHGVGEGSGAVPDQQVAVIPQVESGAACRS